MRKQLVLRDLDTFVLSPKLESGGPRWGPVKLICLSVHLVTRVTFWQSQKRGPQLKTAHEAAGHGFKSPEWNYNMSVHPSI